jgi:hypothetical protein
LAPRITGAQALKHGLNKKRTRGPIETPRLRQPPVQNPSPGPVSTAVPTVPSLMWNMGG